MMSNVDYVYVLALMTYLSANYYVMYLLFLFGCDSKIELNLQSLDLSF